MADLIKKLQKGKGILRILKIESIVYELLSLHIQQHNRLHTAATFPTSLVKREVKNI